MYTREGCVCDQFISDNKLNQAQIILFHLLKNGFITNKIAGDKYGIRHLPSRIKNLKKQYKCEFENIQQKSIPNRFKQKVTYDEYHLKNIRQVKEWLYGN